MLQAALYLNDLNIAAKEHKGKTSAVKSRIMEFMGEMEQMNCGDYGKIIWRPDKNGKRTLRTYIKNE